CIEARSVRSPSTTSAPSRRRASARWSSTPNQGAHLVPPCEQEFGEVAADAAHSARCSGHEDRVVGFMFHRMSLTLGYVQKTNWRRARWNERQEAPPGRLRSPASGARCPHRVHEEMNSP